MKSDVEWLRTEGLVEYPEAVALMQQRVKAIQLKHKSDLVWLVEHPHLYTAGSSAQKSELLTNEIPVFQTNRGGKYTYHGPGVRTIYLVIDLKDLFAPKKPDIHQLVTFLQKWIIETLAAFGIKGESREGRIGIWVNTSSVEKKIASIGIKVTHWIIYHGIALNINPDLSYFKGIIPCGLTDYEMTSMEELGVKVELSEVDEILKQQFSRLICQFFSDFDDT